MTTIEEALRRMTEEYLRRRKDAVNLLERAILAESALEAAKARIAELEADRKRLDARIHRQRLSNRTNWEIVEARGNIMGSPKAREAYCRLLGWLKDQRARAERAEESLHLANGVADLAMKHRDIAEAECKAMREALQNIVHGYFQGTSSRLDGGYSLACIARAALNSSPAGREG